MGLTRSSSMLARHFLSFIVLYLENFIVLYVGIVLKKIVNWTTLASWLLVWGIVPTVGVG
jgi:hypothetical protein